MKCQVLHSSTGVCIRKNKTVVNIKNPLPSAPLGLLQFQTDIINLSLEVCTLKEIIEKLVETSQLAAA